MPWQRLWRAVPQHLRESGNSKGMLIAANGQTVPLRDNDIAEQLATGRRGLHLVPNSVFRLLMEMVSAFAQGFAGLLFTGANCSAECLYQLCQRRI